MSCSWLFNPWRLSQTLVVTGVAVLIVSAPNLSLHSLSRLSTTAVVLRIFSLEFLLWVLSGILQPNPHCCAANSATRAGSPEVLCGLHTTSP